MRNEGPKTVEQIGEYRLERYRRFWAIYDRKGDLVCVAVYRKGAEEVIRRLTDHQLSDLTSFGGAAHPTRREGKVTWQP